MPVHGADRLYIGDQLIVGGKCKPAFPYYDYNNNTILYCPLNEDFTDKTGNYTLTASGSPSTGEYDGIDVTYFNGNYIYTNSDYSWDQTITVSIVAKMAGNGGSFIGQWQTRSAWRRFLGSGFTYQSYTTSYARSKNYTLPDGWFTLTVILYALSGGYPDVYLNGSVASTTTGGFTTSLGGTCPIYIGWDGNGSSALQAYISNVIVEKGARTSSKISEWHNQIKNYYGIA